jgi:putative transposase
MSERRACRVAGVDRPAGALPAQERRRRAARAHCGRWRTSVAALAIAGCMSCYGVRAGLVNKKRVQRIYQEERLMVRKPRRAQARLGLRAPMAAPDRPNACWSLDFVHDQMTDGRRFRVLAVVDNCTRECLALVPDTSISGARVARELDRIIVMARPTRRDHIR